jgi:hypothetical protein
MRLQSDPHDRCGRFFPLEKINAELLRTERWEGELKHTKPMDSGVYWLEM